MGKMIIPITLDISRCILVVRPHGYHSMRTLTRLAAEVLEILVYKTG